MDLENKEIFYKKKTDLLKFQKSLNEQFSEIASEKIQGGGESVDDPETLGLSSYFGDLYFFLLLQDLQSIATKLNYENSVRTKSWILGFNQDHGNIYTIFNMEKVFNLLIENRTDFEIPHLNMNSNIIYLKKPHEENYGLLMDNFKLDYTAQFRLLFNLKNNNGEIFWETSDNIDFDSLVTKEQMSEIEWELLTRIYKLAQSKQIFEFGIFPQYNKSDKYLLLSLMVKKVYLDPVSQKPVFVLNVQNLTKFLINVSPF